MKITPSPPPKQGHSNCLLTNPLLTPFLLSLPGFSQRRYWALHARIGDLGHLFKWPLSSLLALLPEAGRAAFADFYQRRERSSQWQQFVALCQPLLESGVTVLTHVDEAYPELLAATHEPPPVLFVKGDIAALSMPQLALVGSRNASIYGLENALQFARYLASTGIIITSGLALGIDGQAHRGALAADGKTVAVLGTGIDRIYPARHRGLAAEIVAAGGALVSEFQPGTQPHSGNFPSRNRIISGLSLGVLVVEAALKSGSLITARCAIEQNRDVFAIPGSINSPLSRGCHALIRDGATLVETAEDIGRELAHWLESASPNRNSVADSPVRAETALPIVFDSPEERALWACVGHQPSSIDQLVVHSKLDPAEVLALISGWQLLGLVQKNREGFQRVAGY